MSKYIWLGILLASAFTLFFLRAKHTHNLPLFNGITIGQSLNPGNGNKIQVALILDTSNSMDGLLEQAKSQLWKLINELSSFEKNGQEPIVEIALFQFGNEDLYITKGYIEQIRPLSSDLDLLSERLFSLSTNGGNEYCGWAIKDALEKLEWSPNPRDLKMIFIAGNEPFNQGPEKYQLVCKAAKRSGIIVNTIHCGDYIKGKYDLWEEGAQLGGGKYLNIDHNDQVVHTSTPYDDDILRLYKSLNTTYISYGEEGEERLKSQTNQDKNASQYTPANVRTRAFVKTKKVYSNESWDLVDYTSKNDLSGLSESELPEKIRQMEQQERLHFIDQKRAERVQIQKELQEYEEKVKSYIANHRVEMAQRQTLDNAMLEIIQEQAKSKGFFVE